MRLIFAILFFLIVTLKTTGQICINEYLSLNLNVIVDEDNEYSDWIELYNTSNLVVDLNGLRLSDDKLIPDKWIFPAFELQPHSHLLLFASGKDKREIPVTYQTIIDMGDVWQYLLPSSDIGTDWQLTGYDITGWQLGKSGFGYGDGDDSTIIPTTISVFIRKEFTLNNISDIASLILHVDYDDGFVAYINGHEIARQNLGLFGETIPFDRTTAGVGHEALMYQGGDPEMFMTQNPQDFLVEGTNVIAIQGHNSDISSSDLSLIPILTIGRTGSGYTEQISPYISLTSGKYFHTNFKISDSGESFYLYSSSGNLIDSVGATPLLSDVSFGRQPDGTPAWYYFGMPTPGTANNTIGSENPVVSNSVIFSPQGGKHLGGVALTLSSANPSDSIYYTLNGSVPGKDDYLYTGVLSINSSAVVRARVFNNTALPGPIVTNTYITEINHDLPIVCISTDSLNLWDDLSGIFALGPNADSFNIPNYGANFWQDWEKPVHCEYYDIQGNKKIDQGSGMKTFGGWSRSNPQKSVALFARKTYGKGSFEYKLFADKPIDKFESFVLRNGGNDYYSIRFHDEFITGMASEMNIDRQAFQPAAVYLNGQYWGLLNIREKVNEHFVAENHNVDPDQVNLLEYDGSVIHGSNLAYRNIIAYLNVNTTLVNEDKYKWVENQIDLDNYIQYQLTEIYVDNRDWPGNNIKFWNTNSPGSKWRWILFDTDFGFGLYDLNGFRVNSLDSALATNGPSWPNPPWSTFFFRRMVTNLKFRYNFINQYADRLNTTFIPGEISTKIDSLKVLYDNEIQYHFGRWGGSYDYWKTEADRRKLFGLYRPTYARAHLQQVFNLGSQFNIKIEVSDINAGRVKVNTVIPKKFPFNGIYFENVPIKLRAVPLPGYKFVRWEGSNNSSNIEIDYDMAMAGNFKAIFEEATAGDMVLVINEINYNSSAEFDTKDWVEIMNNGLSTVDLENWLLSDSGPESGYFFPAGLTLTPDEYIVVCRNLEAFKTIHPNNLNSVGDMPFGLSVNGDLILLYDDKSNLIDAVNYYPYSPWPENANGTGATIELINPNYDNTKGENWKGSNNLGTPGNTNYWYLSDIETPVLSGLISTFECYPNPFTDFTTLQFNVTSEGKYRLEVYNIEGKLVSILSDRYLTTGNYYIDWFGTNQKGDYLPNGIYFVRLSNNSFVENIKTIILK